MKILFLTLLDINLDESGIYNDLICEFAKNHHQVTVLTATENPLKKNTVLQDKSVLLIRVYVGHYQKSGVIKKTLSLINMERLYIKNLVKNTSQLDYDLVLYSTPPITLAKTIRYLKTHSQVKSYLLLKDIFPQNALDLGMLNRKGLKGLAYNYFKKKEARLYELSDFIGCMSPANVKYLLENNPDLVDKVVEVCPNTLTPLPQKKLDRSSIERIREHYHLPKDTVIFLYGGNLGKPQGIPFIIDCLKQHEIKPKGHILIVGSGTEYSKLKKYFDDQLPKHATLIESLKKEAYDKLVSACDVGLIFLDHRFTIPNFPSRLLSYMQASLPVLAATDTHTDIGHIIQIGAFGDGCESKDPKIYVEKMNQFLDKSTRLNMGQNARRYLEENYTSKHAYEIIMKHFKD